MVANALIERLNWWENYAAQDGASRAAVKWLDIMLARCRKLAEAPAMGVERADIRKGLRLFPAGRYLILYEIKMSDVEIVRVLHGSRQWQDLI